MNADNVSAAISATGTQRWVFCPAISVALPVLRELVKGIPWYARWAAKMLVDALEDFQANRCGR